MTVAKEVYSMTSDGHFYTLQWLVKGTHAH